MQYTEDQTVKRQIFSKTESVLEFVRMRDFAAAVDFVGQIDVLDKVLLVPEIDNAA
jgi:hypothetical protein